MLLGSVGGVCQAAACADAERPAATLRILGEKRVLTVSKPPARLHKQWLGSPCACKKSATCPPEFDYGMVKGKLLQISVPAASEHAPMKLLASLAQTYR